MTQAVQRHIEAGAFFAIDPGADAALGSIAPPASGSNAVRAYGAMRENVVALGLVARRPILRTARRAKKSAAGYDLTRIFVGCEGDARHHHRGDREALPGARGHVRRGCVPEVEGAATQ